MIWRVCQLIVALLIVGGGAWLIGLWAVGVVLVALGLVVGADAVLRSDRQSEPPSTGNDVLDRYRRSP